MAEEQKEEFEGDRTKGFVSFAQPFVFMKDEQDDDVKQFITEQNYQSFVESIEDDKFNSKGIPFYYLTFYEVQDQESPCQFFPEDVRSSNENEVSPTDWNIYSSCCRISKGRFIVTGGVSLQLDYTDVFTKKFEQIANRQRLTKEYKEYIDLLSQKNEGETVEQQRARSVTAFQKGFQLKKNQNEWTTEPDYEKQKQFLIQIFQDEILKVKQRCEKEITKLDREYCKENGIEYKYKEDLSADALVFNLDSPYSSKAIEISFNFVYHEDKYEFTARYIEPLPVNISNHQSVFHKGKLYVLGGVCKQNIQKSVYAYDVLQKSWTQLPDMNTPRINFTAVSHGDYIVVLGGHTQNFSEGSFDFSNLERYNPEKEEGWQKITFKKKMGLQITNHYEHQIKLVSYKDQLILFGGGASKNIENPKEHTQLSKIDILADNKWQLTPIESKISVRKGELIVKSTYRGEECFYIYGGVQKLYLECCKLEVKNGEVTFEKILDNDYTEEVSEYDSEHVINQPNLYID